MSSKKDIPIHNFSQDDISSVSFKIIKLGAKLDYDSSIPHRHNYYEIFLFESGGGFHEVDFKTFDIKDKSIHFVSPGQVHKVQRELGSIGYIILFSRDFFYSNSVNKSILFDIPFLNNNTSEFILIPSNDDFIQLQKLFANIETEHSSGKEYKNEAILSYLNLILLTCKRLFDKNVENKELYNDDFQKFRKLLESEFEKNHLVSDYAEKLGITEKQLTAATKRAVGKTALELIHERIILEAKRLLKYTDHNIKEIAYFLSFEDPSHFGKFFKNAVGLTPNDFRKES